MSLDLEAALSDPAARTRLLVDAAHVQTENRAGFDATLDELARRAAAGSGPATELLLELTHRLELARPAVTRIILDTHQVDDVVQLVLMAVEARIDRFEGRSKYRTWLYSVARNEALMQLRRRQDEPTANEPTTSVGRFSSVIATRETVESMVNGLPEPYQETLKLQLYEQLDYEQLAARLDVPIGTIRSRLAKARALLREAFDAP